MSVGVVLLAPKHGCSVHTELDNIMVASLANLFVRQVQAIELSGDPNSLN